MAKLIMGVHLLFFLILFILFSHRHLLRCSLDLFNKGEEGGGFESSGRRDIERRLL